MNISSIYKHPLFRSSLIYTLCDVVNKAVPFLILPVLSFYLLPSDYGIIANFNVLLSIVSIFVMIGLEGAIGVNYYKLSKEKLSEYVFNGLFLVSISASVVFIFIWLFNDTIYSYVKVTFQFQLLIVLMALANVLSSINLMLWRLEEKAFKFGFFQISQTAVNLGVSLFLVVVFKLGWVGRAEGMLIASLIFGFLSFFLIYKRGYLKFNFNKIYFKEILLFGLPLVPHSLSFWLRSGIDRIFITKYLGEAQNGLYATGFQFGILISFLTLAFNNAFVPYMYKLLSTKDEVELEKNKRNLVKMVYLGILSLAIICLLFTFLSNVILKYFFSEKYGGSSSFIFWAILSQTFQGMYLFFVNYIFFAKKTKFLAVITFACASLQVVLSYILVRRLGAIGAAYSTVIVSFVNFVAVAIYSNKVYDMPWLYFKKKK